MNIEIAGKIFEPAPETLRCRGCAFLEHASNTNELTNAQRYEGCNKAPHCGPDKVIYVQAAPRQAQHAWMRYQDSRNALLAQPSVPDAWPGLARSADPATSQEAAAVVQGGKIVDRLLHFLGECASAHGLDFNATGKELAAALGIPLNSITPRLAPLRRKGLIHDSGVRRDKQIAWALGNGIV